MATKGEVQQQILDALGSATSGSKALGHAEAIRNLAEAWSLLNADDVEAAPMPRVASRGLKAR